MPDAVTSRLSEAFAAESGHTNPLTLILYVPFGVVRAEITRAQLRAAAQAESDGARYHLITVQSAVVEHYSNHLPTGNYATLDINTSEIAGLVILPQD